MTDLSSCISIAYAYDEDGNGGSNGNGDVTWCTPLLKRELEGVFEQELVKKVDEELDVVHIEE